MYDSRAETLTSDIAILTLCGTDARQNHLIHGYVHRVVILDIAFAPINIARLSSARRTRISVGWHGEDLAGTVWLRSTSTRHVVACPPWRTHTRTDLRRCCIRCSQSMRLVHGLERYHNGIRLCISSRRRFFLIGAAKWPQGYSWRPRGLTDSPGRIKSLWLHRSLNICIVESQRTRAIYHLNGMTFLCL